MLNKLSFNLMNELNESETRTFKIKKKIFMESDGAKEEKLEESENTFKYVYYPDEIKKILVDNISVLTGGDSESEAEAEMQIDESLNNIKRIESESEITMIPQVNNDSFPGFKTGKVRTVLKDDRTFISEENELPLIDAIELTLSNLEESALNEKYSEKLGGDHEDFITDVEVIKAALEGINTDNFGSKLAVQMVWDWIDTCDSQIQMISDRYADVNESEKLLKEDSYEEGIFQDVEEALDNAGFHTERYSDAGVMTKNLGWIIRNSNGELYLTCDGTWLDESALKESTLNEAEEFKVGDIVKVPYKYGSYTPGEYTEAPIIDIEDGRYVTVEVPSKQVVHIDQLKKWNSIDESALKEEAEMNVKDLQVIKEQGNVYMLEDKSDGKKYIVGENYNLSEGEIENAEIYENKEDADKDYLDRCDIIKTEEEPKEDTVTETDENLSNSSEEEKINNLKMMDNIARKVNDEDLFYGYWLSLGVPDEATEEDYKDIANDNYNEIEEVFKKLMKKALEDGLYNATEEELEFARKYEPKIENVQ